MDCRAWVARVLGVVGLGVAGVTAGGTLMGCAVAPATINCSLKTGVLPATATADHTVGTPGDQQSFNVGYTAIPAGCAAPATNVVLGPQAYTWVSSDPLNAPISNAKDATAGVATCVGATTATISTSPAGFTAAATLTCK